MSSFVRFFKSVMGRMFAAFTGQNIARNSVLLGSGPRVDLTARGSSGQSSGKNRTELRKIKKEMTDLKKRLTELEARRTQLEKAMGK